MIEFLLRHLLEEFRELFKSITEHLTMFISTLEGKNKVLGVRFHG